MILGPSHDNFSKGHFVFVRSFGRIDNDRCLYFHAVNFDGHTDNAALGIGYMQQLLRVSWVWLFTR